MNSLYVLFKKELLEIIRSKKLLILIILFGFIAVSSPILAKLLPQILKSIPQTPGLSISLPDPTWKDAVDQLVKNISQIGVFVIIIMFAGSIADEKNKKTLEIILTKPISRPKFILAKFLASIFATKIIFILAMILFYIYTASILGGFSIINFIWLAVFLLVYISVILSLTLFFSTISSSQIMSVGLSFFTAIIVSTVFGLAKNISKYSPDFITVHYKELFLDRNLNDFIPSIMVSLIIIIVLIVASTYFFKKQEIER